MNVPDDFRRWIRPSFLPVLAQCAGAARMSEVVVNQFGEPPSEDVAELGSDIHACVTLALYPMSLDVTSEPATDMALAKFPLLSDWDKACAKRCVEFALELVRRTQKAFPDDPVEVLLEHHLDGSILGIDRGGTADLIVLVPFKVVSVVDWKTGFIDQGEASEHDALATYAAMAGTTFKAKAVQVYLFQPRSEKGSRASGSRFDAADLKAQEAWTREVVAAATDDNPTLTAALHCTKCRAISRCPEVRSRLMQYRESLEFIGTPTNPESWADAVDTAKLAEKYSKDVQAMAKDFLKKGGAISRWKLQDNGTVRQIDSPLAVKLATDAGVVHLLLQHITVKASAADAIEAILPAVSEVEKGPSLKPVKAKA